MDYGLKPHHAPHKFKHRNCIFWNTNELKIQNVLEPHNWNIPPNKSNFGKRYIKQTA